MSTNQEAGSDGASDQRPDDATTKPAGDDAADSVVSDDELGQVSGGGGIQLSTNLMSRSAPKPSTYTIKP